LFIRQKGVCHQLRSSAETFEVTSLPSLRVSSLANILVPQVGMIANELAHECNAGRVFDHHEIHAMLPEKIFCAHEVLILTHDDARDSVQQRGSGAHDAGAKRTHQGQLGPVAAAASIADADDLGVGRWIASLHPKIMTTGDDAPVGLSQNGAYGQATLTKSQFSFVQ